MKREFTLAIDGEEIVVSAERDGDVIRVTRDGSSYEVRVLAESVVGIQSGLGGPTGGKGPAAHGGVSSAPRAPQSTRVPQSGSAQKKAPAPPPGAPGSVSSPMTGVIDQVLVTDGESVTEGQVIVVLEAMKMFIDIMAPHDGTVSGVAIAAGESVKEGQALLSIETGGAG